VGSNDVTDDGTATLEKLEIVPDGPKESKRPVCAVGSVYDAVCPLLSNLRATVVSCTA
jgi:hypothetical protein